MQKNAKTLELVVEKVSKVYWAKTSKKSTQTHVTALNNISFSLTPGLYGLLGPNGAGKSTLIHILTNGIYPTKGKVLFNNHNIIKLGKAYRGVLGFMPQQQNLYSGFTGLRFLQYMAALKQIPKQEIKNEIERVTAVTNLSSEMDKRLSAYSGGMKQRLLAATAIMGNPKVLIFDEPTAGLDPKERVNFRNYLRSISDNNIIIVATHVVSDIETVAHEIIILKQGELVAKDTPQALIDTYAKGHTIEDVYLSIFGEEANVQTNGF